MADLTAEEQRLFAKYWGVKDLHLVDEFWTEVLLFYTERVVPVPLPYNPYSARRVLEMLECPPGKCGLCCRYEKLPVDALDLNRIAEHTDYSMEFLQSVLKVGDDGSIYIPCIGGCPFLRDNACDIYEHRPNVCYFYPINQPRLAELGGQPFQQMTIRVKCPSSVNIIRILMTESLASGGLLLPDLSIVPPHKEGED